MESSLASNTIGMIENLANQAGFNEHQESYMGEFTTKVVHGSEIPQELVDLRKQSYSEETRYLELDDLFDVNDRNGEHFLVYNKEGELVGSVLGIDATQSNFSEFSGVPNELLKNCFLSTRGSVDPRYRKRNMFAFLLHLSLRHYRRKGHTRLLTYCEPGPIPAQRILQYTLIESAEPRIKIGAGGREYKLLPYECRIDEALIRSFDRLEPGMREQIIQTEMALDIKDRVTGRVQDFYKTKFFKLTEEGLLSKNQYIETMANTHYFVRWTTRILGHAVGVSTSNEMVRHYVDHLKGEINHQVWIEEDLQHLGADVEFVKNKKVGNSGVLAFKFAQESLVAFHRDPIVLMGVPIAIEGISAFMGQEFINQLRGCIENWGIENPSRATKFFASHTHTDGADDGHWVSTFNMMLKYVRDEADLQEILGVVDVVFEAMTRAYDQFVEEPELIATHSTDLRKGAARV